MRIDPYAGRPILSSLAFSNNDGAMVKIEVLELELKSFGNPHAGSIEKPGEELILAMQMPKQKGHFTPGLVSGLRQATAGRP